MLDKERLAGVTGVTEKEGEGREGGASWAAPGLLVKGVQEKEVSERAVQGRRDGREG
jgi:hypothetical protein